MIIWGLMAYAPDWISDTGAIEVFPDPLRYYCPKGGKHEFDHVPPGFVGTCWWECWKCRKKSECGCS